MLDDQAMIQRIWTRVHELQQIERADESRNESGQLRGELRKLEEVQERYTEAFEEGGLEPQLLNARLNDLSAKRSAVEIRLTEIESRDSDLPEKAPSGTIDLIRKALAADRSQEPGRLRDLLHFLIREIEVSESLVEFTVRVPGSADEVLLTDGQVELRGLEPLTSAMPWRRSPS